MDNISHYLKSKKDIFLIYFLSIFVGISSGLVCALFGKVLLYVDSVRAAKPFVFIPFLPLAGLLIVFVYTKFGKNASQGMSLIFETALGKKTRIYRRMISFSMISTWLSNFFGASVGREGVAVQIGADLGFQIAKPFKNPLISKTLLIAGIAGGFGGLFRTPLAAVCFALEVLVAGELIFDALIPALIAAHVASFVSGKLGLHAESIPLNFSVNFSAENITKIIIASILFMIVGQLFSDLSTLLHKKLPQMIKNPYLRVFITGACISAITLVCYQGRYSGLSLNINHAVFNGGTVYAWDWILKLIFTVVCLSAGFQGGELTPLFCIGASFGYAISGIIGLPPVFCAALGYAAVFGSATNTFLTPITIAGEIFGFQNMHYFFVVCAIAYAFNRNHTIYSKQQHISAEFLKNSTEKE